MTKDLRILIVDDNARFLDAARALLEADGMSVVALASSGAEAEAFCQALRPDVALVDVTLGAESGFSVARALAEIAPLMGVILISTHAESDFHELIVDNPARGFLPKSELSADAIRRLLAQPRAANGSSGT
ncbi:MAG TPA: response regulator transcription factor [Solirubrobacteraceae bacterium]|jgi:DNA-binding NarL/FixJ family response regulator|nr:response regulator transcription factor [Solirubrobacteraceae bacterium]